MIEDLLIGIPAGILAWFIILTIAILGMKYASWLLDKTGVWKK